LTTSIVARAPIPLGGSAQTLPADLNAGFEGEGAIQVLRNPYAEAPLDQPFLLMGLPGCTSGVIVYAEPRQLVDTAVKTAN
jgi:hypothetical protein